MDEYLAAYCGDYCGKCPNYPVKCKGCIPEDHPRCYFIRCARDKGLPHCGLCPDLPCQKLSSFCPDDRPGCPPGFHIQNLRERKRLGTQIWLAAQREKWR